MKHLAFDNMKKNPAVNPFASAVKPKGLRGHFVREGKVIKNGIRDAYSTADLECWYLAGMVGAALFSTGWDKEKNLRGGAMTKICGAGQKRAYID